MLRFGSCIALLVVFGSACAAGTSDGLTSLSGAYTAGPADGGDTETEGTASAGDTASGPGTTVGSADGTSGGDGGNPLCCEPGAQAGCDSMTTEACVCTSLPSCCQNVWSQECVDLAIACGDPFCGDAPATDDGPGTDTGVELECDGDFEFSPANPAPGVPFTATFTDPVGLVYVGMSASGPGGAQVNGMNFQVTEDMPGGPYHWTYDFGGLAAGVWTFAFTHRESENGPDLVRGTCQKQF